jgi:hypothetical protein
MVHDIFIWNYHHHKHPGLGHLARSVSRVKVALSIVSLVSQLFSFFVGCKGIILKGFGFVAFFAGVKASSFCIHLSCLVCNLSVVRGEWGRLFCSHKWRSLPEVSVISFLLPQFFVSLFETVFLYLFINCNLLVTRWQYTFKHKQYIEQHKWQPNNTNNNIRIIQIQTNMVECGPCPVFASFTLAFTL